MRYCPFHEPLRSGRIDTIGWDSIGIGNSALDAGGDDLLAIDNLLGLSSSLTSTPAVGPSAHLLCNIAAVDKGACLSGFVDEVAINTDQVFFDNFSGSGMSVDDGSGTYGTALDPIGTFSVTNSRFCPAGVLRLPAGFLRSSAREPSKAGPRLAWF